MVSFATRMKALSLTSTWCRRFPVTGFTPLFLQKADFPEPHAAIHCLAHVVDREQGGCHGSERFHFHSGTAEGRHLDFALHRGGLPFELELDTDVGEGQRVAKGNQLARALCRLNCGDVIILGRAG